MNRLPEIAHPSRKAYPSDLSDAEWELLKPLLPPPKGFGHPVAVDFREILNGIFYVQRSGCQWEMMPPDLPPHSTVYSYFQKWQRQGVWQAMPDAVRHKLRQQLGRSEDSTGAIADSQSVKTTSWLLRLPVAHPALVQPFSGTTDLATAIAYFLKAPYYKAQTLPEYTFELITVSHSS